MSGLGLFRLHPGFRRGSSSSDEETRPTPNPQRVKRALFGPTDHEENLRFVRNEMKKAKNEASNRWNFDFDRETPLKGRFDWEAADPSEGNAVYNRLTCIAPNVGHPPVESEKIEQKENRVSSLSSEETTTAPTSSTTTATQNPLEESAGSVDDLRTPQQTSGLLVSSSSSSSPSTVAAEPPQTSELGARPKNTKEKKLTDLFRSRKSRSKSSSKLRLKRLEGGISSRSPSVKSRVPIDPVQLRGSSPSDGTSKLDKTEESD